MEYVSRFDDPLAHHVVFHSSDVDEARAQVGRIFCPHRLDLQQRGGGLDARHHSVRLKDTSVNYVAYGGDVRIVPGELESFFVVQAPLAGKSLIRNGKRQVISRPGLASVPDPTEALAMAWATDCAQLIVRIERRALEDRLSDLIDRPIRRPIRFDLGMNLTSGRGRRWWELARFMVNEIDRDSSLVTHPSVITRLEDLLMTGLLLTQPHNFTDSLSAPARSAGPQVVRQAVDMIEAHPELPLTPSRLAVLLGVSVRSLQEAFRRHLGTSPSAYLQDARLHRAHADLLAADPSGGLTVTDVAGRWGFTHLGRFSASYRELYGKPPSHTLRR